LGAAGASEAARNTGPGGPPFPVDVPPGLSVRMSPEDVARVAESALGPNARVLRMSAVAHIRDVSTVENFGKPGRAFPDVGPVWVVRGDGQFIGHYGPPGAPPPTSRTGFYVVADRTGQIIGMGMP